MNALALAVLNTLAAGGGQPAEILYVLATDAQAFADFEMTNQEFVDACVIVVNDNRIEVRLADG